MIARTHPYGAVTAESAQLAKTGTAVAGTALQTVGGILLPIPVVGWIVGGLLTLAGTALQVGSSQFDPERAAAREAMLREGTSPDFANEFARAQAWPNEKIVSQLAKRGKDYQRNPSPRTLEQIAALRYILNTRTADAAASGATLVQQQQLALAQADLAKKRQFITLGGAGVLIAMGLLLLLRR